MSEFFFFVPGSDAGYSKYRQIWGYRGNDSEKIKRSAEYYGAGPFDTKEEAEEAARVDVEHQPEYEAALKEAVSKETCIEPNWPFVALMFRQVLAEHPECFGSKTREFVLQFCDGEYHSEINDVWDDLIPNIIDGDNRDGGFYPPSPKDNMASAVTSAMYLVRGAGSSDYWTPKKLKEGLLDIIESIGWATTGKPNLSGHFVIGLSSNEDRLIRREVYRAYTGK